MVTEEKIVKKFQCNAELVEKYIKEGTFGKDAEITVGYDPTGVPSIVVNVGKSEIEDWLIRQLKTILTQLFRDESGEPGLVFPSYSVEYASGCPTKIYLNYQEINEQVEYDMEEAKKEFDVLTPMQYSGCCAHSLERLWEIHSSLGSQAAVEADNLNNISSTLKMCKNFFDLINVKEGQR